MEKQKKKKIGFLGAPLNKKSNVFCFFPMSPEELRIKVFVPSNFKNKLTSYYLVGTSY